MSGEAPTRREVAYRVFAAEYRDATHSYSKGDEERAPNYVLAPSGVEINRLFLVGVATEIDRVNEETVRARIVDPTGAFVVYASQYQPDARARFEEVDPPEFLAVTGKSHTFRPEDGEEIYTSVRPEAVAIVDAETRDRWIVTTARHTLIRLGRLASAIRGENKDEGVRRSLEVYNPSSAYVAQLYDLCLDTLRMVAGEISSVEVPELRLDAADSPHIDLDRIVETGMEFERDTGLLTSSERHTKAELPDEEELSMDPEEPVLTEAERAEVTEAFSVEFTTGDDLDPAKSAEPNSAETEESSESVELTEPSVAGGEEADESSVSEVADAADEPPETDPEEAIVKLLADLDEGEGVEKATIIEVATTELALDTKTAEDALESAMLAGACYESPTDIFHSV